MNSTQNQPEIWKPIPGFEGSYEVSDHGRVRSLDRLGVDGRRIKGKMRKIGVNTHGYLRVSLSRDHDKRYYLVHRLVLEAFVGPCPDGMEGCHNDGDPTNANLYNLRWDTRSANMYDKQIHGTDFHRNKTHCPKGHPLSGDNLVPWYAHRGYRKCKICHNESVSKYKAKKRKADRVAKNQLKLIGG